MNFNDHSELTGSHAFLGASNYHWINYTNEKLIDVYRSSMASLRGTMLHDFASTCIKLNQRLPRSPHALNAFVNDAITFQMKSEQILYFSENCFGTADAICFSKQLKSNRMLLRIHDLKTGKIPGHIEQLLVYAALFCLEYSIKPSEIDMELRIYQEEDIKIFRPTVEDVYPIMDKIIAFDEIIKKIKLEEGE